MKSFKEKKKKKQDPPLPTPNK